MREKATMKMFLLRKLSCGEAFDLKNSRFIIRVRTFLDVMKKYHYKHQTLVFVFQVIKSAITQKQIGAVQGEQ